MLALCPDHPRNRTEHIAAFAALSHSNDVVAKGLNDIRTLLQSLMRLSTGRIKKEKQQRVIEALRFPAMDERYIDVPNAAANTYGWILSASEQSDPCVEKARIAFKQWLSSTDGSDGSIFHISGKPGSGKSTLMKFICDHPQTMTDLRGWAGASHLVVSHFFFWRHGHVLQRTIRGLVRALLASVLAQIPNDIPRLFPGRWTRWESDNLGADCDVRLSDREIRTAFDLMISNVNGYHNHKFCFFIDGLDEFNDDGNTYSDLVGLLWKWVGESQGAVKFCVSSRELPVFQTRFCPKTRIRVQDLTQGDIKTLVRDSLAKDYDFRHLEAEERYEFEALEAQIVGASDGVFLWVTLVLRSLRQGLQEKASFSKLRQRLSNIPSGLDELFESILDSIDETNRKEAYYTFALLEIIQRQDYHMHTPFLLTYSFLEDVLNDPDYAVKLPIHNGDDQAIKRRLEHASARLNACCRGLVEAVPTTGLSPFETFLGISDRIPQLRQQIKFIHRTVPDFLKGYMKSRGEGHLRRVDVIAVALKILLASMKSIQDPFPPFVPFFLNRCQEDYNNWNLEAKLCAASINWEISSLILEIRHLVAAEQVVLYKLLDSLDQIYCLRQTWLRCDNSLDIDWRHIHPFKLRLVLNVCRQCYPAVSILHLSAYEGLGGYVWWKIDQHPGSLQKDCQKVKLYESIMRGLLCSRPKEPGFAMLEALFDRGLGINDLVPEECPQMRRQTLLPLWVHAISVLLPEWCCSQPCSTSPWTVLEIFLKRGADPRYHFHFTDEPRGIQIRQGQRILYEVDSHRIPAGLQGRTWSLRDVVEYVHRQHEIHIYNADSLFDLIDINTFLYDHFEILKGRYHTLDRATG
jgi:hypothetical protein